MNTVAWQQQKLNTQLASWAQLRHDNLLYAKQSYSGGIGCSFPHSFVEPYPEFYRRLGRFSNAAHSFFSENLEEGSWITSYFKGVGSIMDTLAVIAEKELLLEPLQEAEMIFLKSMLDKRGTYGGNTISGWLSELYFETYGDDLWVPWGETDYVIADVHTQSTDESGNFIGKVLHVGTGKVNLGVFLVDHPSDNDVPTAYVGPFQSYYEHFTLDFDRKTDEWWSEKIDTVFPERPDWTNVYLIDYEGNTQSKGRESKVGISTSAMMVESDRTETESLIVYPNPVINDLSIKLRLQDYAAVNIELFDASGRLIKCLLSQHMPSGEYIISRSLNALTPGMYYLNLSTEQKEEYLKFIKQ
jgi:hypothetical protein